MSQPGAGNLVLEGPCFYGSEMPTPPVHAAPHLGEHTRNIRIEELAMDPAEIDRLVDLGASKAPLPES